jgi:hypothetical protein
VPGVATWSVQRDVTGILPSGSGRGYVLYKSALASILSKYIEVKKKNNVCPDERQLVPLDRSWLSLSQYPSHNLQNTDEW